ncbi:MAG: UDP-glucose/GDP-mannose dehydrogenase family protein [Candidatus Woesearchaeota archaeon]
MKISIAGTGYVGLASGVCLASIGNEVCCYDIDKEKIDLLNSGSMPIYEPGLKDILEKNKVIFTTDAKKAIKFGDVIFIGVGTPSREDGSVNLEYVDAVARDIGRNMDSYKVIVNKSTVPVGTSERVASIIRKHYKGEFDVVSNPEFLREGCAIKDFLEPDRIVIGSSSQKAKEIMLEVYKAIPDNIFITDTKSSELIKYASNTFLAFCISYVNGLVQKYPEHNVHDLTLYFREKINPKGFFSVGVGYGGSCFPKDVREFSSFYKKKRNGSGLFKEIIDINERQKLFLLDKVNGRVDAGDIVCILGLGFKPDTDDVREAPSLALARELLRRGCKVRAYDPVAMEEARKAVKDIEYCDNPYSAAKDSKAVFLVTEWDEFKSLDLKKLRNVMDGSLLCDGRNLFDNPEGFDYYDVGRGPRLFSVEEKEHEVSAFLRKCGEFADSIRGVCDCVGAKAEDVLKGMMLDKRIGDKVF